MARDRIIVIFLHIFCPAKFRLRRKFGIIKSKTGCISAPKSRLVIKNLVQKKKKHMRKTDD